MNESLRNQGGEKCANCPNRSRISRVLARIAGTPETAPGCEGPVEVARGEIFTQHRRGHEPSPPKGTWNHMTSRTDYETWEEIRRYNRTDWTTENVCGREPIERREGEISAYVFEDDIIQTHEGERHAAFIKGDEEQIQDYKGMLAIMRLLDGDDSEA